MAIVTLIILTWAGLLIGVAVLLPKQAQRAEQVLEFSTGACLLHGLVTSALFGFSFVLLNLPVGIIKLAGFVLMLATLGIVAIGAAGIAKLMGRRIAEMSGARNSFATLCRGAGTYSLAMGFPFIGWWVVAPISLVFAFGAGSMALLQPVRNSASPYDVMEQGAR